MQTRLRLLEMHPFCLRHLSTGKRLTKFSVALRLPTNFVRLPPRRGRFALRLPLDLISITKQSAARSAPSGGKVVRQHQKGCIYSSTSEVVWYFHRPIGRLPGFIIRGRPFFESTPTLYPASRASSYLFRGRIGLSILPSRAMWYIVQYPCPPWDNRQSAYRRSG